jgi:hypothetical protein
MADIGPNVAIVFLELWVRIQKILDANFDVKTGFLDIFQCFSQSLQENSEIIGLP